MATQTTYNPTTFEIDATKVEGFGQGVGGNCNANATTNFDIVIADDVLLTGITLVTGNVTLGDYATLKVLLTANSAVLKTPVSTWYLAQNNTHDFQLIAPMKITAGLTLRIAVTTSVVLNTPFFGANFKLWKILI